ncbi:hypothetical protein R5P91_08545 [Oenococcus oeni]
MSNFDNYQISNNFKIQGFWGTSLKQALDEKKSIAGSLFYEDGKSRLELFGSLQDIDFYGQIRSSKKISIFGISFDGLIIKSSNCFQSGSTNYIPGYKIQRFELLDFSVFRNVSNLSNCFLTEKTLSIDLLYLENWLGVRNRRSISTDKNTGDELITYQQFFEEQIGRYTVAGIKTNLSIVTYTSERTRISSFEIGFSHRFKFKMLDISKEFSNKYSIVLAYSLSKLLTLLIHKRSYPISINESYRKKGRFNAKRNIISERSGHFKIKSGNNSVPLFSLKELGLSKFKDICDIWFDDTNKINKLINNYLMQGDYETPVSVSLVNLVSGIEIYYSEKIYGNQKNNVQAVQKSRKKNDSPLEAATKIYKLIDSLPKKLTNKMFASDQGKIYFARLIINNRVHLVHGNDNREDLLPEAELWEPYHQLEVLVYAFIIQKLTISEDLIYRKLLKLFTLK